MKLSEEELQAIETLEFFEPDDLIECSIYLQCIKKIENLIKKLQKEIERLQREKEILSEKIKEYEEEYYD